jgi:hypothetical protein
MPREGLDSRINTVHFNIGTLGAPALAPVAGVADPAALAFFGQINVAYSRHIRVFHIHMIVDGSGGDLTVELWRLRGAALARVATATYTAPVGADFVRVPGFPLSADVAVVREGDYLLAQAVAPFTLANADGLTVDVHAESI